MKTRMFALAAAITLVGFLAGCPTTPPPPTFDWGAGLFDGGGGCENSLSAFITNDECAAASFQLWQQNSQGTWLPTQDQHSLQFGPIDHVTLYRVNATYQGQDVFWWNGGYLWSPYGYPFVKNANGGEKIVAPGPYYPWYYVPWAYLQGHSVFGHLGVTVQVDHMDVQTSEGFDLYAVFPDLPMGTYRVKITGTTTDNVTFAAATTDGFTVDTDCSVTPPGGCDTPNLTITSTPLFGDNNGHVKGTVCLDDPSQWDIGVYAHVNSIWPDPYDLVGVVQADQNGDWDQQGVQTDDDRWAVAFYAVLVPVGTNLPTTSQGVPEIPERVSEDTDQREPYVVFVGNPTVSGGANCKTNYYPALFGAIAYVQETGGAVHQQPMYSPADANTYVTLTPNAQGTECTFHIALNQVLGGSSYNPSNADVVKVQILPKSYDYVKTETGAYVDNLLLNLVPGGVAGRGSDVQATLVP